MKIQLIHPPHYNSTDDRLDPPLGLLLIASYLRYKHPELEIEINDLSGYNLDFENIRMNPADFYGVTVYAPSAGLCDQIAIACREGVKDAVIIAGGAHPSAMHEKYTHFPWDYVVVGEGEEAMEDIIFNAPFTPVFGKPVKEFLFPAFDLVDINSYHRTIDGERSLPLLTSRGCIYNCAFCGLHKMHELGKRVRFAKPEVVEEHVSRIKDLGIKAINFQDDMFTMNRRRLYDILERITPFNIKFRCHGRAGYDNEEVYERLAKAGCAGVSWGIESGSQKMLDLMNKENTVQDNYNVIKWAKKYGITSRAFFVIGFPGETDTTLRETKHFIEEAQPDQYFVSNFVPYPGTDVWINPKKYGIIKMDLNLENYYQVGKDGLGGLTIETEWLSREEFRDLELWLRGWLRKNIEMKGSLQSYERKQEGKRFIRSE